MSTRIGVLVMAYGGPGSLEEVEPYLRDVRGYRETPADVVAEVRERYAKIGGRSPILERTTGQAEALGSALRNGPGVTFEPIVGMRHWHPYIGDALARLAERGVTRAVGLVMAPHYSRLSIGAYYREIEEARSGVTVRPIESWYRLPGYLDAVADRIRNGLSHFPESERDGVWLLFTAHSLPRRIVEWNDPYSHHLEETVRGVMARVGDRPHRFAYQSAGLSREPWLGPDAESVVDRMAGDGVRNLLVVPVGFVCEHVEVLYDVDLELKAHARARDIRLERIEMLNDHPALIAGLAGLVLRTADEAGWLDHPAHPVPPVHPVAQ
jgi:ferrochelatase